MIASTTATPKNSWRAVLTTTSDRRSSAGYSSGGAVPNHRMRSAKSARAWANSAGTVW